MAPRIARHNGDDTLVNVFDWNGSPLVPGRMVVVDDENAMVRQAVEAGTLELDPTIGRHYEAGPTERRIRPTEGTPVGAMIPRTPGEVRS